MTKRIITYLQGLFICLSAFVSCGTKSPLDERKTIYVVFEVSHRDQEAKSIIKSFSEEFADTSRYNMIFFNGGASAYDRLSLHKHYVSQARFLGRRLNDKGICKTPPDLVILLDDLMAQAGVDLDHPYLRENPVLCLNVMYPEWKDSLASMKNFAVMQSRPEPKKNIDFIREMGGPSWVVTVIDSTFLDEKLRSSIMEQMGDDKEHYITNLQHETYDRLMLNWQRDDRSTIIPINLEHAKFDISDTLINANFHLPGILRIVNNNSTFLRLKDDVFIDRSLGSNLDAYYSGVPRYFNIDMLSALNANMGGYMAPWREVARQSHPLVDRLLAGEDPASIPWQTIEKDYWLDWRVAKRLRPYASDFPKKVKFVNLPWAKRSRKHEIVSKYWKPVSLILLVLLAIIIPSVLAYRNRRIHRSLIKQGETAELKKKQTEDILAAIHAYNWEILPENIVYLGDKFADAAGLSNNFIPLDEILSRTLEGGDKLRHAIEDSSRESYEVEVVADLPSTGIHAFIVYVNHILDEKLDAHCYGFIVFNDDAYESERIRKESFRLEEETSVKESFLAAMSHEIRSPLNAIVGFSDLLIRQNRELSPEERANYAFYINDNTEQLLKLLDDVMNYSHRKDEHFELELTRKDIRKFMEEVYYTHKVIMPKHLELVFKPGPDAFVKTNRSAILQIMSNLMNNAIKFTEHGSITIGWEIVNAEKGREAVLYVEDTGVGISEDDCRHIFDKFYKAENHTQGAGLGLTLCMQLADSLKGRMEVYSTLGKGSRFSIRLAVMEK